MRTEDDEAEQQPVPSLSAPPPPPPPPPHARFPSPEPGQEEPGEQGVLGLVDGGLGRSETDESAAGVW